MHCVVHYNSLKNSSEITPLTETAHQTLKDNKLARQRLGGQNEHAKQCETVPDVRDLTVLVFIERATKNSQKEFPSKTRRRRNKTKTIPRNNDHDGLEKEPHRFSPQYVCFASLATKNDTVKEVPGNVKRFTKWIYQEPKR